MGSKFVYPGALKPFVLCFLFLAALRADVIVMKNGDRFTGSVVKSDNKTLTFKSEYAGQVNLPWDAVVDLKTDKPVTLDTKNGAAVVGPVTTQGQALEVGTQQVLKTDVATIRSEAEQQKYERMQNPKLFDLWAGYVDLGLSKTQGNSKTTSLNINGNANRVTAYDKTTVTFTSVYSSSNVTGARATTADARRGTVSYNRNLSPHMFLVGEGNFESDALQNLNFRFAPSVAVGYHVRKRENSVFDIFAGGSYDREYFAGGERRSFGEGLLGEELTQKISNNTTLHEKFTFYPNLTSRGDYRIAFDANSATTLRKWLSWQVTISDRLLSNPVNNNQQNDLLISTGFRITFALQ